MHGLPAAHHHGRTPLRCAVCDAALPPGAAPEPYPGCAAVACRMVLSRRAGMGELQFRHHLALHVAQLRQHRAANALAQVRQAAEAEENTAAWAALRRRLPAGSAEPLALLLPSGPRRQSRAGQRRLAQYRAHVLNMVAEARLLAPDAVLPSADTAAVAAFSTLPGQLCGQCGGGCCTGGANRAYLDAQVVRSYMNAHPDAGAGEVADAYLAHVPARVQTGSCINHAAGGCGLPRDMRSETCNRYACASLARLLTAQCADAAERVSTVLVVRRKRDHWTRHEAGPSNAIAACAILREQEGG